MRITHIVPTLDLRFGGPSRSVAGLASAQAISGHQVVLVAGGAGSDTTASSEGVDVRTATLLPVPFAIPSPALIRSMNESIRWAEIVHLHSLWNGVITVGQALCRRERRPSVLCPRGMLDSYSLRQRRLLKSGYLCAFEGRNLDFISGFHFLDEAERKGCRWLKRIRNTPYAVIPNGLDDDLLRDEVSLSAGHDAFAGLPKAAVRLLFLGRLDAIKDLELQVKTLAILRARRIDAHLYLVGPDYGEGSKLRALASSLAIDKHLSFIGAIYDARRLEMLRQASAVLLTSHYECNSRSAAETLGAGGVLLAARRCHVDSAVAAGAAVGLPADPEAFARAVEKVASDTAHAAQLRRRAAEFARNTLPWHSVAARTLSFYERLLGVA